MKNSALKKCSHNQNLSECLTIEKNIRNFLRNFYNVKVLRTFIVYYGFQGRGADCERNVDDL